MEKIIKVVELEDVIKYFKKDFKVEDKKVEHGEYYIDPIKGKIIFEMYIK